MVLIPSHLRERRFWGASELTIWESIGSVNTSAFVSINPTGELITSGLPVIRPRCATCGIEFQLPVQSQVKDERQVRPEIHLLFSPVAIKFNFE